MKTLHSSNNTSASSILYKGTKQNSLNNSHSAGEATEKESKEDKSQTESSSGES